MARLSSAGFAALACFAAAIVGTASASTERPLATALMADPTLPFADTALAFRRMRAAGATAVRIELPWRSVAPAARPVEFDAADPADPAYRWESFDARVKLAVARGLEPIVVVNGAPSWAEGDGEGPDGTVRPDPRRLGEFARAAATRYSARFNGLPRIRYWQVWNEPNLNIYLSPAFVNESAVSPEWYRRMVNEFAKAVHGVRRDNLVIAGGQTPFTFRSPDNSFRSVAPLQFMREMLCMSKGARPRPTCRQRARFDVWAHHPYTSGGPTHEAYRPDDVSLGDLPEMRRLLDAAVRTRHVISEHSVRFWVTEFSWDTNPPDPKAVPIKLHTRWVAEALYRMWKSGVSLVTWLQLRDNPYEPRTVSIQSGLYFRGQTPALDRPKPALRAFRFPFVAFRERGRLAVWGRTPWGRRGRVVVEQRFRGGWKQLAMLPTNRHGIFEARVASPSSGDVRARESGGQTTVPFSLTVPPDFPGDPFGHD